MTPKIAIVRVNEPIDSATFQFLLRFSPPEKQQRILRQRVKQNADTMVSGGALARYMLWTAFRIPLAARISYGKFGKPYLPDYPDAHFNISHSGKYVACAIYNQSVGIDIQIVEPYHFNVAKRVCTSEGLRAIEASDDPAVEFARIWTRKEAYLKMLGCGLLDKTALIDTNTLKGIASWRYEDAWVSLSKPLYMQISSL